VAGHLLQPLTQFLDVSTRSPDSHVTDLTIFTVTWARDTAEEALLARALEPLVALGHPIIAADRTNTPSFTTTLTRLGIRVASPSAPNLVAQVQAAAAAAAAFDARYLLYTEPDKELFFRTALPQFLANLRPDDDTGVVLAARTGGSLATFPPMQRYVERVVNTLCAELIGPPGDFSYGPFLMHRRLLSHVATVSPALGWGWRTSTFLAAHHSGQSLLHWVADLPCPPEQRGEDAAQRRHRLMQLAQNVSGLCAG
jgi:hypothetical protein